MCACRLSRRGYERSFRISRAINYFAQLTRGVGAAFIGLHGRGPVSHLLLMLLVGAAAAQRIWTL